MSDQHPNQPLGEGLPMIDTGNTSVVRRRKKSKPPWIFLGLLGLCLIVIVVGIAVMLNLDDKPKSLFSQHERMLFAQVDKPVTFRLGLEARDNKSSQNSSESINTVTYTLDRGPEECKLDANGTLHWTPKKSGTFSIQVSAIESGNLKKTDSADRKETRKWTIIVDAANRPPQIEPIGEPSVRLGETLTLQIRAADPDDPPRKLEYRLLKGSPKGVKIDPKTGLFTWTPEEIEPGSDVQVRVAVIEAIPGGLGAKQNFTVRILPPAEELDLVYEEETVEEPLAATTPPEPTGPTPKEIAKAEREKLNAELLDIYDRNRVFLNQEYPTFRKIYAKQFEIDFANVIRSAYGKDYAEMNVWLEKHPAIKEELYTAIDPKTDNVDQTLKIFADLVKRFPKTFPDYYEAAIATAVTWDAGPNSFSYAGHQRRTKSILPPNRLDGIRNFEYLAHAEMVLGRHVRAMPWEFLIHVVNHPTPIDERRWAVENYLDKIIGIGKCYHDVPYDSDLLNGGGDYAHLNGHDYTLPEIRQCGGVCAHQADYASRVAKSLGVPASYVGGQSRSLDNHAWVMWIELQNVAGDSIQFEIKSHGRYSGDKYYVGSLKDPKTRKRITDRQLELRLHNIGFGVQNKRHTEMIMQTYPLYCKERNLDVDARLRFLGKVIALSPGNEDAWLEIARMSADHEITAKQNRLMRTIVDRFFITFANFPDFTWTVFDDLIAYRDNPKEAAALYEQLITMYVNAKRPDLGCKAVLRYADRVSKQGWTDLAVDALATMILTFPDEGRYVPKMLDRLESFVGEDPKMKAKLVTFYKELIPKIPKHRGKKLTDYCQKMYRRASRFFEQSGDPEAAAALRAELARLKETAEALKRAL